MYNKFRKKSNGNKNSWILASPEEIQLLDTLKDLHRLNNKIGKENESYINFISEMNRFYGSILADNKNKQTNNDQTTNKA